MLKRVRMRRRRRTVVTLCAVALVAMLVAAAVIFTADFMQQTPCRVLQIRSADANTSSPDQQQQQEEELGQPWQKDVSSIVSALRTGGKRSERQLAALRFALRGLEHRLESGGTTDNNSDPNAPLWNDAEAGLAFAQRGFRRRQKPVAPAGLRGLWRALSVQLSDNIIDTLKDVADKLDSTRRPRPPLTVPHKPLHDLRTDWNLTEHIAGQEFDGLEIDVVCPVRHAWQRFHNGITQYELYGAPPAAADATNRSYSYVDQLLVNMATLPIVSVRQKSGGTQLKLDLTLSDGTKLIFKPMRLSKNVEKNPNAFNYDDMERHHAEIAAFHLDKLLGFRRVPPVAGRYVNLRTELLPLADRNLARTFFTSFAGNVCFFGQCAIYCDQYHAVCGTPDVIEGSCATRLPEWSDFSRLEMANSNPWSQGTNSVFNPPRWKTDPNYCEEVRRQPPHDTGRRLLDVIDMTIFDFLIGNLDRHHFITFKKFGNFSAPVLCDHGKGFGRALTDDIKLLAALQQCCTIRASTFIKLVSFLHRENADVLAETLPLSAVMRRSLAEDVIPGVLSEEHLAALDRRLGHVALVLHDCLQFCDIDSVIVDDGL